MRAQRIAAAVLFGIAFAASAVTVHTTVQRAGLDVVHSFASGGSDGASSGAPLVEAADGTLYGTTFSGGAFDKGTIFKLVAGTVTVLHSFSGGIDGGSPFTPVIQARDGSLYGTAYKGGAAGLGTIFKLNTDGSGFTTIYSFMGGALSGANPRAALLQAADDSFYGTTELGGSAGRGVAFRMVGASVDVIYTFTGGIDGAYPYAPLMEAADGYLYGTTYSGDVSTYGRIFRMTPAGDVTVMHTFLSGQDGANPVAGLIQSPDGNFYGTTYFGGPSNAGTVFRMSASGDVTVLSSFNGASDGANLGGGLLKARDGNFYGTARVGASGYGTIFRITPAGTMTILHRFGGGADGAVPSGALIQARSGKIYGTTGFGGTSGLGVVFRFPRTALGDFDGDGRRDIAVFRPSTSTWFIRGASFNYLMGDATDVPVPADYDGDGKTDVAIFRPSSGAWSILNSSTMTGTVTVWGSNGDRPVPADYDGDGRADIGVFRPWTSTWYIRGASMNYLLGESSDTPVPGDYDGDGKADVAVFRASNGTWSIVNSSTLTGTTVVWGSNGDRPVPGDYDGDGRTDVAVFRPWTSTWFIRGASNNPLLGDSNDVPVPGDYDGDGKVDVAVFRPSTGVWYILQSSLGGTGTTVTWGGSTDIAVPKNP